jgi:hypothetical protein
MPDKKLAVTALHELPGRLRVRLSHPLADAASFDAAIRSHEGIEPVRYTPITRTVLLRFDTDSIRREELLVRVALTMSLQYGNRPVRIRAAPPADALSGSVAVSGAMLLAAGLGRAVGLGPGHLNTLDRLAGLVTGSAVVSHAAHEIRQRGEYHPEVISVAYLAVGMLGGNAFRAAVLTWSASFGRHLLESTAQAVEVRPEEDGEAATVTASVIPETGWRAWLHVLPGLLRAFSGAGRPGGDLLGNLREVSRLHDQMLDALGPWKKGIPMRFPETARRAGKIV